MFPPSWYQISLSLISPSPQKIPNQNNNYDNNTQRSKRERGGKERETKKKERARLTDYNYLEHDNNIHDKWLAKVRGLVSYTVSFP